MITNRRNPESEIADSVAALHTLRAAMTPPDQRFLSDLEGRLFAAEAVPGKPEQRDIAPPGLKSGARVWFPERAGQSGGFRAASVMIAAALLITSLSWFALRDEGANTLVNSETPTEARPTPTFPVPTMVPPDPLAAVLWQYQLPENELIDPTPGLRIPDGGLANAVVTSGDVLVRLAVQENFSGIEGFDATSGALKWRREIDRGESPIGQALQRANISSDETYVYLYATGIAAPSIHVIDPVTGEDVRVLNVANQVKAVVSNGFQMVVLDVLNGLTAFNVQGGEKLWSDFTTNDITSQSHSFYVGTQVAVVIGSDGELIAFELGNGEERWRISTGLISDTIDMQTWFAFDPSSNLIFSGKVAGSTDQRDWQLVSVSLADGSTVWETPYRATSTTNLDVGQNLAFVLMRIDPSAGRSSSNTSLGTIGRILVFDRYTGEQVWQSSGYQHSFWHTNLTSNGYFAAYESWERVVVYQAHNGNTACVGALPEGFVSDAVIYDNSVIYSYMDGSLVAIDIGRSCDLDVSNQVSETGGGF